MKIQVTQEHIDQAFEHRINSDSLILYCPIALAATDAFVEKAAVASGAIHTHSYGWYYLPLNAHEFIRIFDQRGEVYPFEFETYKLPS